MVDKLYLRDMYQKEFDALVTRVDGSKVYLDKTAFYPTGGGQPNDTGRLVVNGIEVKVTDAKKDGDEVAHTVDNPAALKVADKVHGIIDWANRYAYMRHHTAIHILDGIVTKSYSNEGIITGSQIYADRARMDFDMPNLNRELAQKIIDETNYDMTLGRKIIVKYFTQEQALTMPSLVRTQPGRELIKKLAVVRVVEIEGLDMQMDGGLHVLNSNEVGKIVLKEYKNQGSHSKRVEIKLE